MEQAANALSRLVAFVHPPHCERTEASHLIILVPYLLPFLQSWLLFHAPPIHIHKWIPNRLLKDRAQPLRLAVIPVQLIICLRITLGYDSWAIRFLFTVALSMLAKSIEVALMTSPPVLAHSSNEPSHGRPPRPYYYPGTKIPLWIEYITSYRGCGWQGGLASPAAYGTPNPPTTLRDPRTIAFLKSRAKTMLWHLAFLGLAIETVCSPIFISLFDAHPSPVAPVNPLDNATPWRRVLVQALCTLMLGICIPHPIQAGFSACSIISTLLWPSTQTWWEPMPFDNVYSSHSVYDFWTRRWHSFFRQIWITIGYAPAASLALAAGLSKKRARQLAVVASFAVSGVFHEVAQHNLRRSYAKVEHANGTIEFIDRTALHDTNGHCYPLHASSKGFGAQHFATFRFFFYQAFGILLEMQYTKVTGKRVGGWLGSLWALCFITLTGAPMLRTWLHHGFQEDMVRIDIFRGPAEWGLKTMLRVLGGVSVE